MTNQFSLSTTTDLRPLPRAAQVQVRAEHQGIGIWREADEPPSFSPAEILEAVARVREPLSVILDVARRRLGVGFGGVMEAGNGGTGQGRGQDYVLLGTLAPLYPEWLGDRSFTAVHRVRFPYVVGEMANGIASVEMVVAAARAQMLGFFGAAGLPPERVEEAIRQIRGALGGESASWGSNLIHSPMDPAMEDTLVALYLKKGVTRVSASAFMDLTPAIVRFAASGLTLEGSVLRRRNFVFAKISRPEVARRFMSPAPEAMLEALVAEGHLTRDEALLARRVPVAEDVTVEADSGGHTDNRPLTALFSRILSLRDELCAQFKYTRAIRVGAAGGLGTPTGVAAAFSLGAAYVLTGSVNQAAVEAGLSPDAKRALAAADLADVAMAPSADMFELGVKVQVLKRGTLFSARAGRLYELFLKYEALEELPAEIRGRLEKEIFQTSVEEIWSQTRSYFSRHRPEEIARAEREPRHRMALVFRWYLGQASRWAITGESTRRLDYQIWCGPAMGAFNAWVKGSCLEALERRTVSQIGLNLLEGAAVVSRAQQLRGMGVNVPGGAFQFVPRVLG